MSFNLRANEEVIAEAKFHWSSYVIPVLWACFGVIPMLGMVQNNDAPIALKLAVCLGFFGPFGYTFLANKSKKFILTNQRFYLEMGIFSKNLIELPIPKINDVSFRQSFIQRLFGTGSFVVLTGNSKPTIVSNIDQAREFRELLGKTASKLSA